MTQFRLFAALPVDFAFALLVVILWSGLICPAWTSSLQERVSNAETLFLDCRLLDVDGKAIAGVEVYDSPPFASVDSDAPTRGLLSRSDSNGRFRVDRMVSHGEDLCVFVVAKGRKVEYLSAREIGIRPIEVRLQSETPINVMVVDEQGIPMQDVKVGPKGMRFVDGLTHEVVRRLQTTTDSSGKGSIQGSLSGNRQGNLNSIELVSMDGKTLRYQVPSSLDPGKPLTVRWVSSRGSVRCRVNNAQGDPVPNSLVIVESPNLFPDETRTLPEISFHRTIFTDANGECLIDEIPVPFVWAQCMTFDDRGQNSWIGPIAVVENDVAKVELKLLPTQKVRFSVLDGSDFLGHPNINVRFMKTGTRQGLHSRYRTVFATGVTEEDGQGIVTLEVGEWEASLSDIRTLPEGYVLSTPLPTQKFEVTTSHEPKPVAPFVIKKGRQIQGQIEGLNPLELPADWIFAVVENRLGEETSYSGKVQMNGQFSITVPLDSSDAQISSFQAPGFLNKRGKGSLAIVSKSPWKLEAISKD